jgi:ArsR family transcriptional regulator
MKQNLDYYSNQIKLLADPTRLGILLLLARNGEVCVCEMAGALDVPDFKISRHLAILRKSNLISFRREGLWIYYRLSTELNEFETSLIQLVNFLSESEDEVAAQLQSCCEKKGASA